MKIRTGRTDGSQRLLYLQLGEQAHDTDPLLGYVRDGTIAAVIADAVNRDQAGVFTGPHRVLHAVRGGDTAGCPGCQP